MWRGGGSLEGKLRRVGCGKSCGAGKEREMAVCQPSVPKRVCMAPHGVTSKRVSVSDGHDNM